MNQPAHRRLAPIGAGLALGIACFYADLLDDPLRSVLQFLASTGFAWGAAAFVTAFPARTRTGAAAAAVTVLGIATAAYYGLNFAAGRWRGYGLAPVLTAMAYWLLLSVISGAVLGGLAHLVRTGGPAPAATAGGLAGGLLAGAGIAVVVTLLAVGDHGRQRLLEGVLQAVAGVAVIAWLFARRPGPRAWPRFAAVTVVAGTSAAVAWSAVESVRVIGF